MTLILIKQKQWLKHILALYREVQTNRDVYVKDLNGDGVIDDDDKTILGNPYPCARSKSKESSREIRELTWGDFSCNSFNYIYKHQIQATSDWSFVRYRKSKPTNCKGWTGFHHLLILQKPRKNSPHRYHQAAFLWWKTLSLDAIAVLGGWVTFVGIPAVVRMLLVVIEHEVVSGGFCQYGRRHLKQKNKRLSHGTQKRSR